jgi:hypothetical protein
MYIFCGNNYFHIYILSEESNSKIWMITFPRYGELLLCSMRRGRERIPLGDGDESASEEIATAKATEKLQGLLLFFQTGVIFRIRLHSVAVVCRPPAPRDNVGLSG